MIEGAQVEAIVRGAFRCGVMGMEAQGNQRAKLSSWDVKPLLVGGDYL